MEGRGREWRGSPLDMSEGGMDPYGKREVVIESDSGDQDVFRPRRREEFGSYDIEQGLLDGRVGRDQHPLLKLC